MDRVSGFLTRQKRVLDLKFQESFAETQIVSSQTDLFCFNLSIFGF